MSERDSRTESLIGEAGVKKLRAACVAVVGLGGVGGFAAEALARSGVGTLYLYDKDVFSVSNLNRQLFATECTVGGKKTEVAAQRIAAIDPDICVVAVQEFITPQSVLPWEKFDAVIDAVDNVTAKLFLAQECEKRGLPLISVMGTGNKLHPERLRISELSQTNTCPLCRVMRKESAARGIAHLRCVWSDEMPISPSDESGTRENGRKNPGSMIFVPAAAGLLAAADTVQRLLNETA